MRVFRNFGIIFGIVILILTGCGKEVAGDEKTAEEYVKAHGYKITSYESKVDKYTLDKDKLYGSVESTPYNKSGVFKKKNLISILERKLRYMVSQ